ERRRDQEPEVGEQSSEELSRQQLAVTDRIREEELERAELPLLGEEPHGEERQHEEDDQAVVEEHEPPEAARLVGAPHQHEEHDVAVEEVAREADEDGAQDGGERSAAHGGELAAGDEEGFGHSLSGGPCGARPLRGLRSSDAPRPRRPAWPLSRPASAHCCEVRSGAGTLRRLRASSRSVLTSSSLKAIRARKASSRDGSTVARERRGQVWRVMRVASSGRTSLPGHESPLAGGGALGAAGGEARGAGGEGAGVLVSAAWGGC